jgi:hypothetical protein
VPSAGLLLDAMHAGLHRFEQQRRHDFSACEQQVFEHGQQIVEDWVRATGWWFIGRWMITLRA